MRRDGTGGETAASLAHGTESAMTFSGWHARVFASMECRRGHAGQGYPADRATPGLSMLAFRVSMAPVPIAVQSRSGVEKWSREVESAHRLVDSAGPRRKAPKRSSRHVTRERRKNSNSETFHRNPAGRIPSGKAGTSSRKRVLRGGG